MHTLSRRRFALATLAAPSLLKAANKPDKMNLAFIGPGGHPSGRAGVGPNCRDPLGPLDAREGGARLVQLEQPLARGDDARLERMITSALDERAELQRLVDEHRDLGRPVRGRRDHLEDRGVADDARALLHGDDRARNDAAPVLARQGLDLGEALGAGRERVTLEDHAAVVDRRRAEPAIAEVPARPVVVDDRRSPAARLRREEAQRDPEVRTGDGAVGTYNIVATGVGFYDAPAPGSVAVLGAGDI